MNGASPTTRRPIRRLSSETVERIAAGEVVERPASVVKELVENSVDASAGFVTVRLTNGGLERIEVADDGGGIPPDELELAVERHATNKLDPDGPVERIGTLGFRGEALAAIGSVSRFRLVSRPRDRDSAEGISVVGGKIVERFLESRSPGTTVQVEDLFFNTPARRKFLKSAAAEQVEVLHAIERLYLAQPRVGLRVESEGREVGTYPPAKDLTDAAARVLGPSFLGASFVVQATVPGGRLSGALGRPGVAAPTPRGLFVAVNGRAIVSRPIAQNVRLAYGDYLPRTRFPVGVLHLELDPARLDVNVHPTKREIRFAKERDLLDAIRRCCRESLVEAPLVAEAATSAPRVPLPATPRNRPEPLRGAPTVTLEHQRLQRTLEGGLVGPREKLPKLPPGGGHPRMALLGCFHSLYWVAETDEGFVLIDQHAASERVLYEEVRSTGALQRQTLVSPVALHLTAAQRETLSANAETVRAAGFEVEPFGPESFLVRSVPAYRGHSARAEAVTDLLDEIAAGGRPTLPDGLEERRAATIACHAAIRAGDTVSPEEFSRVLTALHSLPEAAYSCPHGRPIVVGVPRSRVDRWFLRSGT
ncbi:MAG TPA: DNA mismatch repair endonuclease MutL [Thermoplasmata archaeon]|nr:DNA mismatch repair endonuclease MutL [Thermoplasmata archaeon]